MRIFLLFSIFLMVGLVHSQDNTNTLQFDFQGVFQLSDETNNVFDFDKVSVRNSEFDLMMGSTVLRTYKIVNKNVKTGFEMDQISPALSGDELEKAKIVVYPILLNNGNKLKVQLYSSNGYSEIYFNKTN